MSQQPPQPSSQQIQVTPEQLQQLIIQHRNRQAALSTVLDLKKKVLVLLENMESYIAEGKLSEALGCYVEIQKLEYSTMVESYKNELAGIEEFLKQAESPVLLAHGNFRPPPRDRGKV